MRGALRVLLLVVALFLAATEHATTVRAEEETCPGAAPDFQSLPGIKMDIAYRWEPAELKVGQFFAIDVVDCNTFGVPVERIAVDAIMPAHGHGMNYRPKAERIAPGHYRFTGMMLHMPGIWRFRFILYKKANLGFELTLDVDLER